jgi:hypothetical protein
MPTTRQGFFHHLRRVLVPVAGSGAAAGLAWWLAVVVDAVRTGAPTIPGALDAIRSVYLVALVTSGPNLLGLAWLDRSLSRHPAAQPWLRRGLWVPIGAIYGLVVLVAGVCLGVLLFILPALVLVPGPAPLAQLVGGVIGAILGVPLLYPVAVVGGAVGVAMVARSDR